MRSILMLSDDHRVVRLTLITQTLLLNQVPVTILNTRLTLLFLLKNDLLLNVLFLNDLHLAILLSLQTRYVLLQKLEVARLLWGAAESVNSPLLPIFLKDKQDQNDEVTVEIIEVAVPTQYLNLSLGVFYLIRRVIDSCPEKVENKVIKDVDNLRVLLPLKCLPNLIYELGRIDYDHA
jgi:hypothetical protein